ncbi:hypothetical protein [Verrucomicrobium spinosum]|uniref:hypothetical protein n=1 Tax=Verrucomicrobium spinosum TaxID=2736 RepID=UPI00017455BD|nr:hypothetical protein [Verrucomicrobium spinosum]
MNVSEFISKVAPHIGSGQWRQQHPGATQLASGAGKLASLATGVGMLRSGAAQRGWKRWGLFVLGGVLLYRMLAGKKEEQKDEAWFRRR